MTIRLSEVVVQKGMLIRNSQGQLLVVEDSNFARFVGDTQSFQRVMINPSACTVAQHSRTRKRK
jgi:hypothetical protein